MSVVSPEQRIHQTDTDAAGPKNAQVSEVYERSGTNSGALLVAGHWSRVDAGIDITVGIDVGIGVCVRITVGVSVSDSRVVIDRVVVIPAPVGSDDHERERSKCGRGPGTDPYDCSTSHVATSPPRPQRHDAPSRRVS